MSIGSTSQKEFNALNDLEVLQRNYGAFSLMSTLYEYKEFNVLKN